MRYTVYKVLFLLAIVSVFQKATAQLSIQKQDELAKLVCRLEAETEDSIYSDGKHKYKLSFPEESFGFNFDNGKAWKAVYKTNGSDTYLAITEGIDLSKVTGFTWDRSYTSRVLMHFPKGTIKTSVSRNGGGIYMVDEEYLEFFCTDDLTMLLPLAEACHLLKAGQGKIKQADIKTYEEKFSALMKLEVLDIDKLLAEYNSYVSACPGSLFTPIINSFVDGVNEVKKYWRETEITKLFCDSMCKAFLYKPNLYTGAQLEGYNPATKKLLRNKNYSNTRPGENGLWSSSNDNFTTPGPMYAYFKQNGLVYQYLLGNPVNGNDLHTERIKWLEARIPASFFKVKQRDISNPNDFRFIHITHPVKEPCITFTAYTYGGISFEYVTFQPSEYSREFH